MKSKILIFISLITYILTGNAAAVTLSSVATGACKDKKYTFVIKANADGDLAAGSATVTLTSPENTTPTCTYGAVSTTTTPAAEESAAEDPEAEENAAEDRRRLAAGDFDITCEITSKLDNAEIKVNAVTVNKITATPKTGTFPLTMDGKATCEGTTTTTTNTTNTTTTTTEAAKFIQFSGFLFLFILTVF